MRKRKADKHLYLFSLPDSNGLTYAHLQLGNMERGDNAKHFHSTIRNGIYNFNRLVRVA